MVLKVLSEFQRKSNKVGGTASQNPKEGVYTEGGDTYLVKQDVRHGSVQNAKNIAEYLLSKMFAITAPEYGAEVSLIMDGDSNSTPSKKGDNVYVASEFFDDYQDLYVHAHNSLGKKVPKALPGFSVPGDSGVLQKAFEKNQYEGFAQVMVTQLMFGNRDMHWGNTGVIDGKRLVAIDFGWGFDHINQDFDPDKFKFHGIFDGRPFNRFRDYPDELKYNTEFTQELRRVANIDFSEVIKNSVEELKQYYDVDPLKEFCIHMGMSSAQMNGIKTANDAANAIEAFLSVNLERRKNQMIQVANEIDLGLCIDKSTKKVNQEKLEEFYRNNSEFCQKLIGGGVRAKAEMKLSFFYNMLSWLGIYDKREAVTKDIRNELLVIHKKYYTQKKQNKNAQFVNAERMNRGSLSK